MYLKINQDSPMYAEITHGEWVERQIQRDKRIKYYESNT